MPDAPKGAVNIGNACSADAVMDDPEAFGGKAATSQGEYHALVAAKLPAAGDAFTVWVHHKGGPIQLKAVVNGDQQEKGWNWAQPGAYEWCRMGRYPRAELGQSIVIIRGGKQDQPAPRIDCVVLSSDPAAHPKGFLADGQKELPPEKPDDSLPPTTASIQIDWSKTVGQMSPSIWGVNDAEVVENAAGLSPKYEAFLASLHPAILRVHSAGMADAWTDAATRSWKVARIQTGCASLKRLGDARVILNIPCWPSWMKTQANGVLTPEGEEEFVRLVGQLVRIMRDDVRQPITYWELLNERDETFEKLGKLDDLWQLHRRLYAEIKKQDPRAKVGGPALTWPKPIWVESFLKSCGQEVDFVTWHNYASGDIHDSNESVFRRTDALADQARYMKETVAKMVPGRKIECFLDEYNIKWVWDPIERRHGNNVGAVFQSCMLRRAGMLGLDGVTLWTAKGNAYGIIAGDDAIRATGRLYQMGSRCLVGPMADVKIAGGSDLEALAVTRKDRVRSVLLINRADHAVIVRGVGSLGVGASGVAMIRIAANGLSSPKWKQELAADELRLPGYSVTLITADGGVVDLVECKN